MGEMIPFQINRSECLKESCKVQIWNQKYTLNVETNAYILVPVFSLFFLFWIGETNESIKA